MWLYSIFSELCQHTVRTDRSFYKNVLRNNGVPIITQLFFSYFVSIFHHFLSTLLTVTTSDSKGINLSISFFEQQLVKSLTITLVAAKRECRQPKPKCGFIWMRHWWKNVLYATILAQIVLVLLDTETQKVTYRYTIDNVTTGIKAFLFQDNLKTALHLPYYYE